MGPLRAGEIHHEQPPEEKKWESDFDFLTKAQDENRLEPAPKKSQRLERELLHLQERTRASLEKSWAEAQTAREDGRAKKNKLDELEAELSRLRVEKKRRRRRASVATATIGSRRRRSSLLESLVAVAEGLGTLFLNTSGIMEATARSRRRELSRRLIELHQERAQRTSNLRLYLRNRITAEETLRGAVEMKRGAIKGLRRSCHNMRIRSERTKQSIKKEGERLVIELVGLLERVMRKETELSRVLLE